MINKIIFIFIVSLSTFSLYADSNLSTEEKSINKVLDGFHKAASEANEETYFSLLTDNVIFLGTDATERWNKKTFREYTAPFFKQEKGWTYIPTQRNVTIVQENSMAFFDELLDSDKFGETRGSGVMLRTDNGWKIAQYNLSIPMPNDLVFDLSDQIKNHKKVK